MEYKYPEGLIFVIKGTLTPYIWTFHKGTDKRYASLGDGMYVTLMHHTTGSERLKYYVVNNNIESDWFSEEDLEKMIGEKKEMNENVNVAYTPKPPLGVTPKYIYDTLRIQELTRALYEYANYNVTDMNYDSMMKWTQELFQILEQKYLEKNKK